MKDLIEWARDPNRKFSERDMNALADALERLTQPVGVEPLKLYDSQWVNIVNNEHCYENYSKEEAVHLAVKLTEAKMAELHAETVARLQAERDEFKRLQTNQKKAIQGLFLEIDALQEQVKLLQADADKWQAYQKRKDDLINGGLVKSCLRTEALAATEPKEPGNEKT